MGNNQIQQLKAGVDDSDAVNKGQMDTAIAAIEAVTSIDVSGGTTGLTTSGGPVTDTGTITLAGTLGIANGGTGATTLTANNVILGNGTSALQFVAPGTSGNVLTSNGTTWESSTPNSGWTFVSTSSDQNLATSSTTFQDVSGLSFSASANKTYIVRCFVFYTCPAAASGGGALKLAVNGPSSPTALITAAGTMNVTAYDTTINNSTAQTFTTTFGFEINFILKNGANAGTVQIRGAQQTSGSGVTTIYKSSYLEYREIA